MKRYRIRRAHARFLEACRSLRTDSDYWNRSRGNIRTFLQMITPVPLLSLHKEGVGLYQALRWLEANCAHQTLNEDALRGYHKMVCTGEDAGKYRTRDAELIGSSMRPPPAVKVPSLMKQLDFELSREQDRLDAIKHTDARLVLFAAARAYAKVGRIHPFSDGNGRVARLAMNQLMRRYGHGYVIVPSLDRSGQLSRALDEADRGKLDTLVALANAWVSRV